MARFCRQRRSRSSCKRSWKWPEVSCPYLSLQIIAYKYTFLHELACNNCDMHTNKYNKMFIIHYHNSIISSHTKYRVTCSLNALVLIKPHHGCQDIVCIQPQGPCNIARHGDRKILLQKYQLDNKSYCRVLLTSLLPVVEMILCDHSLHDWFVLQVSKTRLDWLHSLHFLEQDGPR